MLNTIRALLIGTEDWNEYYDVPSYVQLECSELYDEPSKTLYDIVFIDRPLYEEEIKPLSKVTKTYTLFLTDNARSDMISKSYFASKKAKSLAIADIQSFLSNEARNYYDKPYGEKFRNNTLTVAQGFTGSVSIDGYYGMTMEGDFGDEFCQAAYWRKNIPIFEGQALDLWLEYKKDPTVEIELHITQFVGGSLSDEQQSWVFTEDDMKDIVIVDNQKLQGPVFASVRAKGKGKLQIIALHDRHSRRGHGLFMPGGERFVSSDREEIFYYFDPGDMRPPLNVYFSGYKTLQGFEGYYMMRSMGCPFLLIAEPRLEGGCFYMGSDEYEQGYVDIIHRYMDELGFTSDQVIMAGLSMGTFGAMYYGCDIRPHAILLGKPLASIGDVAANERLHRPGGFPTSLDVLAYIAGGTDRQAIDRLNGRFWDKFDVTDWGKTKFVVSYMIEDDYDSTSYGQLISHVQDEGVQVYGKGIHGRHNDATSPIVTWFKNQYDKILTEDFGRKRDNRNKNKK